VDFFNFAGGTPINQAEDCKINVLSPGFHGATYQIANIEEMSKLKIGGSVTFGANVAASHGFIGLLYGAIFTWAPSSVTGTIGGYSYQCVDSIIRHGPPPPGQGQPIPLPGNGQAYPGATACRIY